MAAIAWRSSCSMRCMRSVVVGLVLGLSVFGVGCGGSSIDSGGGNAGENGGLGATEPSADHTQIYGLKQGLGQLVAVGERSQDGRVTGVLLTSTDANVWQERETVPDAALRSIAVSPERMVAVGDLDAQGMPVLTSSDGLTWQTTHIPTDHAIPSASHVAYGNGLFMATTSAGAWSSGNATEWAASDSPPDGLVGIVFGGGRFVLWSKRPGRGDRGPNVASSDGISPWQGGNLSPAIGDGFYSFTIQSMRFTNGKFQATGRVSCCYGELPGNDSWEVKESTDGVLWTTTATGLAADPPYVLLESASRCLGIGNQRSGAPRVLSGPNCEALERASATYDFIPQDVLTFDQKYVFGGIDGIVSTVDGVSWERARLEQ